MVGTIGEHVRRRRVQLGLDQRTLAAGVSQARVSLIETNRIGTVIADPIAERLERALGWSSGELKVRLLLMRTPPAIVRLLAELVAGPIPPHVADDVAAIQLALTGKAVAHA